MNAFPFIEEDVSWISSKKLRSLSDIKLKVYTSFFTSLNLL